jgi:hypothetical protein
MADFAAKTGDRLPAITSTLTDDDGNPVDLTDAGVMFVMRPLGDATPTVDGQGEVVPPDDAGQVRYWWAADDLADAGLYLAEWQVTFPDARQQTYPGDRQLVIEVVPSVEDGATITPSDLAWMREWIGSSPDDAALADKLAAYDGKRTLAALGILRSRRADLLADPLSYSIRGDVSVNAAGNLSALDSLIAQLEDQAVADGDLPSNTLSGAVLERSGTWGRGWPSCDPGWRQVTA